MNIVRTNNHFISTGASTPVNGCQQYTCTSTDDLVQTIAAANAQGYSETNTYAWQPTSATGSTVGTGSNETSLCTTIATINSYAGTACRSGTSYGVSYNTANHTATFPALTLQSRPSSAAWDRGAYEKSSALTPNIVVPSSVVFGNQEVNTTSAYQSVEIQNTGSAPLVVDSFALTGPFAVTYPIIANVCTAPPFTLAPGTFCYIGPTFTPTVTGSASGSLTIVSNAATSPTVITLSGTGVQPILTWSPSAYTFPALLIGNSANSTPITLTNSGTATANISISVSGSTAYTQTNTCSSTLTVTSNCTVTVTFAPTIAGPASGTLTETDVTNGITVNLLLSGTGLSPVQAPVSAPVPWDF
jgi:hypothetical protein